VVTCSIPSPWFSDAVFCCSCRVTWENATDCVTGTSTHSPPASEDANVWNLCCTVCCCWDITIRRILRTTIFWFPSLSTITSVVLSSGSTSTVSNDCGAVWTMFSSEVLVTDSESSWPCPLYFTSTSKSSPEFTSFSSGKTLLSSVGATRFSPLPMPAFVAIWIVSSFSVFFWKTCILFFRISTAGEVHISLAVWTATSGSMSFIAASGDSMSLTNCPYNSVCTSMSTGGLHIVPSSFVVTSGIKNLVLSLLDWSKSKLLPVWDSTSRTAGSFFISTSAAIWLWTGTSLGTGDVSDATAASAAGSRCSISWWIFNSFAASWIASCTSWMRSDNATANCCISG